MCGGKQMDIHCLIIKLMIDIARLDKKLTVQPQMALHINTHWFEMFESHIIVMLERIQGPTPSLTLYWFTHLFNLLSKGLLRENITISNGLSQQAGKWSLHKTSQQSKQTGPSNDFPWSHLYICKWAAVTRDLLHMLLTTSGNVVKWKWSRHASFYLFIYLYFSAAINTLNTIPTLWMVDMKSTLGLCR